MELILCKEGLENIKIYIQKEKFLKIQNNARNFEAFYLEFLYKAN